jgi:hypothetical protein
MAQMTATAAAMHLSAAHTITAVFGRFNGAFDGIIETRPAGATVEFLARSEEALSASSTGEYARPLLTVESAASGWLRAMRPHHAILLRAKNAAPFLIGMSHFKCFALHGSVALAAREFGFVTQSTTLIEAAVSLCPLTHSRICGLEQR